MLRHPILTALTFFLYMLCPGTSTLKAATCDDTIARHMVGQALLAAQFVALAERVGMTPSEINAILKNISERSAKQEFWITDTQGRAYLTNTEVAFTFSSNSDKQPQASAFWPLIDGSKAIVIQDTRKREIDDQLFKYVGVAGVDKARIVQIGVGAENLCR